MVSRQDLIHQFGHRGTDVTAMLADLKPASLRRFCHDLLQSPASRPIEESLRAIEEREEELDLTIFLHWLLFVRLRLDLRLPVEQTGAVLTNMAKYSVGSANPILRQLPMIAANYARRNRPYGDKFPKLLNLDPGRYLWPLAYLGVAEPILSFVTEQPYGAGDRTERWRNAIIGIRFVNAINCCQTDLAMTDIQNVKQLDQDQQTSKPARSMHCLLPVMWFCQQVLDGALMTPQQTADRFRHVQELSKFGVNLFRCMSLLHATSAEVETLLQQFDGELQLTALDSWLCLAGVRAALILGDTERAYRMLRFRARRSMVTYQDDLQWMRYHIYVGDLAAAEQSFYRAQEGAIYHQAKPRLEFELRMARELSMLDFANMFGDVPRRQNLAASGHADELVNQLLGTHASIKKLKRELPIVAGSTQAVLIQGPTGSGKDLLARLIHGLSGRSGPLVSVNCATIGDSLLEAELFGHRQGSYTGAIADRPGLIASAAGGTLFLDEIGDTSARFQAALLRLLENNEYRSLGSDAIEHAECRIIAATNMDLEAAIRSGSFRQDLFFRLQQLRLMMPALAERVQDIPLLSQTFLEEASEGRRSPELAEDLLDYFSSQPWPGNVRQLQSEINRLVLFYPAAKTIHLKDFLSLASETASWYLPPDEGPDLDGDEGDAGQIPVPPVSKRKNVRLGHGSPLMAKREALIALFKEHQQLTRKQVVEQLGIGKGTATKYLKQLVDEGMIVKIMPSGAPVSHYFKWCAEQTA